MILDELEVIHQKITKAAAASGVAATSYREASTLHSFAGIPVPFPEDDDVTSNITYDDPRCVMIRKLHFFVLDEAFSLHAKIVDMFERLCRFARGERGNPDPRPFGGLVVVLAGDPRQTLPVVRNANTAIQCESVIPNCKFWQKGSVDQLSLTENKRIIKTDGLTDEDKKENERRVVFAQWLLKLGDGQVPRIAPNDRVEDNTPLDSVEIPPKYLIDHTTLDPVQDMINFTYEGIQDHFMHEDFFRKRCILTPCNVDADDINMRVLTMLPGQPMEYRAVDELGPNEDSNLWSPEVLHAIDLPGLPQAVLCLKPHANIMLMRNLSVADGLVNGTRMMVLPHVNSKFILYCVVLTGSAAGQKVFIPRIFIEPTTANLPFVFKRRQFPVKLCFAMTINKSQSQGFDFVSVYLPRPVFSHGQLYVAASRMTNDHGLRVLIIPTQSQGKMSKMSPLSNWTRNVVLRDIYGLMKAVIPTPKPGNFSMVANPRLNLAQIHFDNILSGQKTREIRLAVNLSGNAFRPGNCVTFVCGRRELTVVIKSRLTYPMRKLNDVHSVFTQMMLTEGLQNVLPGIPGIEEALAHYTEFYDKKLMVHKKGLTVLRIELVTSNAAIFDHSSATSMSASALQIVPTVSKLSFGVKRAGRLRAVKIIPVSSEEESPDEDSGEKQPPLKVMKCADPSSSSPMECTSSVLKRNRPQSDVESGIVKVKREDGREEMLYPSSVSNSKPIISSSSLKRTRSGAESEEYVLSSGEEDMRGLRKRHLKFPDGTSADPEAIELSGDEEGPPQNEFVPPFATVIFDECQVMQDNILHRTRTTALSADASGVRDLMQNRTRDQNVMVMVKFGTEIDTIKMLCLMEFEQLNDEVINVYFRMIELRSRLSESRHKVSVLNTFLMNSLLQNQNGFDYNRVRNYGKKLNGNRMGMVWGYDGTAATEQSRIDLLLIPVHLGNHWILLSVAFKSRTIYCFDSLGDCQSSKLFYALAYLEHEFQKYGLPFYTEQWTQVNSRGQGPQQQNFLDCGVFMTMMADYISLDLEPNYRCVCPGTAEDHRKLPKEFCTCGSRAAIQCFRDHMVLSIAHGKIL